jgi:MerR family mercuric resistance operon transcriptional regulator
VTKALTIGQLARAAGVPTSTVRFYERAELLKPEFRTGSGYRGYGPESVSRLKFIRSAQASGFSLRDISEMLELTYSSEPPCKEIEALIEKRLLDVRERVKELRRVEKALSKSLASCCRGGPDWCGEIERLRGKSPGVCKPSQKISRRPLTLH